MHLGEFLRRYRQAKGLTQNELATILEVSFYRLQKWEKGLGSPKTEDSDKIKGYFIIDGFDNLTEKLLKERVERSVWVRQGKGKKNGTQVGAARQQAIIKQLEEDIEEIAGIVDKLRRKLEEVKRMS